MLQWLITAFLAACVFGVFVWVLTRVKTPHYQLDSDAVVDILDGVLAGQTGESDWQLFLEIPLRHNECLERCRQRCRAITQQHELGRKTGQGYLLDAAGLKRLAEVRERLLAELTIHEQ